MNLIKQTKDSPAFSDVLWNKPESKLHAGKLLIIGGSLGSIAQTSSIFGAAIAAGAGEVKIILPQAVKRSIPSQLVTPAMYFCPSNTSGSFAQSAQQDIMSYISWADFVLFAGEFGKNSETQLLLSELYAQNRKPCLLFGDSINILLDAFLPTSNAATCVIFCSFNQLQRLAATQYAITITSSMLQANFITKVAELSQQCPMPIIVAHNNQLYVSHNGLISCTKMDNSIDLSVYAATAAVWAMQQPLHYFKSLTCALLLP